jgi:hypothetical protein
MKQNLSIKRRSIFACTGFSLSLIFCVNAQGPGGQGGHGPGGGQGGGGFQDAIHKLFRNHEKIKRTVEMTTTGYTSRTISDDPETAKTLQKHVKEMRARLGAGMMIRRWDPAFAELVEHYKEIEHDFKEIERGVEMTATGKTSDAIKVIQNHARIVSGFVKKGPDQMHESHPRVLSGAKPPADTAKEPANPGTPACPKCAGTSKSGTVCPKCGAPAKPVERVKPDESPAKQ